MHYGPCPTVKVKNDQAPGGHIVINESDFDPKVHDRYVGPPPPPPLSPPPGPSLGPLDGLPKDWKAKSPQELRALAQSVTGRTAENKLQAVEMIEAELRKIGK